MRIVEKQYLEHMATVTLTIDLEGDVYTIARSYEYPHYPQNNRKAEPYSFTMKNGVPRWVSNNRIPPSDTIRELYINAIPDFNIIKTKQARDAELRELIAEYRRNQPARPSNEEMAELRANFEPGTTVVNIITGRKVQL